MVEQTHEREKTRGLIALPSGEVPATTQCITLCIPTGADYRRELFGMLWQFTYWRNYERDDTHKATLVAQAWKAAIMEGMLNCYQFRIHDGVPEFSNDGGATWSAVPQLNDGESGHDPRTDEPIKPIRAGTDKRCLAAANATACFVELHREICAWWDNAAIILIFCGAISAILGLFYPVLWNVFAIAVNWSTIANAILTHTDALTVASFTTEIQDDLTCIFYAYADANGQWSQANFDRVVDDIEAQSGSMWALLLIYVQQIGGVPALNNAGTTTTVATYDCDVCGTWCRYVDFLAEDGGFIVRPDFPHSTWSLGTGWQSGDVTTGQAQGIRLDFATAFDLVRVEFDIQHVQVDGVSAGSVQVNDAGYTIFPMQNGDHTVSHLANLSVDSVRIDSSSNYSQGIAKQYALKCRIYGRGTIPDELAAWVDCV